MDNGNNRAEAPTSKTPRVSTSFSMEEILLLDGILRKILLSQTKAQDFSVLQKHKAFSTLLNKINRFKKRKASDGGGEGE